ncbi:MAG: conserved membrane protein of unknown function [Candidatus Thorarchaeota archaeon]|nr:MAG: conserved membrane protein of unknown function [Candidatus Thorarchaeota archaeon]
MQVQLEIDFVMIIGLALILAFVGALSLKRLGVPQIVGFMLAGLVLGQIGVLHEGVLFDLHFLVSIALGLIGYNIGLEMEIDTFKGKIGKWTIIVLLGAFSAFFVVSFLVHWITGNIVLSLVLGALASASAPAATVDVIWENQCEGPVSDTLMFMLVFDDIIAVILTGATIAFGLWWFAPVVYPFASVIFTPFIEIILSTAFGLFFGFIFTQAANRFKERGRLLEMELGMIFLLVGLANTFHFSDIFVCIVYGFIVGNFVKKDTEHVPHLLKRIMSPIVMIFFVIVGAKIDIGLFFGETGPLVFILAITYIVGMTVAKYSGTYIGAVVTRSPDTVRKYLGPCLLCQAGVSIGLGIIIEQSFFELGGEAAILGSLILSVVSISTMFLEIVGPISVKWALGKAGEIPIHGELFAPHDYIFDEREIFDELAYMYEMDDDASTDDMFDELGTLYEMGREEQE